MDEAVIRPLQQKKDKIMELPTEITTMFDNAEPVNTSDKMMMTATMFRKLHNRMPTSQDNVVIVNELDILMTVKRRRCHQYLLVMLH